MYWLSKKKLAIEDKLHFASHHIQLPWNFAEESFSEEELQAILHSVNANSYLVVTLNTSVWAQEIKGFIEVKTAEKKILWKQGFTLQTTYIIQDKDSPYISSFEDGFNQSTQDTDHKQEVIKIYRELGEKLATLVLKKMNKIVFKN